MGKEHLNHSVRGSLQTGQDKSPSRTVGQFGTLSGVFFQVNVLDWENNSLAVCQQVHMGALLRKGEVRGSKVTAVMVSLLSVLFQCNVLFPCPSF